MFIPSKGNWLNYSLKCLLFESLCFWARYLFKNRGPMIYLTSNFNYRTQSDHFLLFFKTTSIKPSINIHRESSRFQEKNWEGEQTLLKSILAGNLINLCNIRINVHVGVIGYNKPIEHNFSYSYWYPKFRSQLDRLEDLNFHNLNINVLYQYLRMETLDTISKYKAGSISLQTLWIHISN